MPILPYRGIHPRIHDSAFIASTSTLAGDVEIGARSSIWYGCVLRGDLEPIRIGARTNLQDRCVCHVTHGGLDVVVGDEVTVGHGAILHGCHIGDRVLVGMQACILDGARIGSDVLIAAGSLVTPGTVIPDGHFAVGRPARAARPTSDKERAMIEEGWRTYLGLCREFRLIDV